MMYRCVDHGTPYCELRRAVPQREVVQDVRVRDRTQIFHPGNEIGGDEGAPQYPGNRSTTARRSRRMISAVLALHHIVHHEIQV